MANAKVKKVMKHLKRDIKESKKSIAEDKELKKSLTSKSNGKKQKLNASKNIYDA